jgi:hypothetical protein
MQEIAHAHKYMERNQRHIKAGLAHEARCSQWICWNGVYADRQVIITYFHGINVLCQKYNQSGMFAAEICVSLLSTIRCMHSCVVIKESEL